jgi:DNA replication and repair protein RecF
VRLRRFSVAGFRNLATQELTVGDGLTLVVGANGMGKTSLLEAISVLGNLTSFRPGPASGWFRHGGHAFSVGGLLERDGAAVELRQEARLGRTVSRSLYRGGRRLGVGEYLGLFPVTSLSGYDRQVVWGPPEERRRLLNRVSYYISPEVLNLLQRYRRALAQRNALLVRGAVDDEFEAFEHDLAVLGGAIIRHRMEALHALEKHLTGELEALGWSADRPNLRYHCGDGVTVADPATTVTSLRAVLTGSRRRDRIRGHTTVGPHRHDVVIAVQGAVARDVLSAGQGKLLATALKLAAVKVLNRATGRAPMVVFDDVDAEFDSEVLERVITRLALGEQAIVSSAHEEVLRRRLRAGAFWRVDAGVVAVANAERSEA